MVHKMSFCSKRLITTFQFSLKFQFLVQLQFVSLVFGPNMKSFQPNLGSQQAKTWQVENKLRIVFHAHQSVCRSKRPPKKDPLNYLIDIYLIWIISKTSDFQIFLHQVYVYRTASTMCGTMDSYSEFLSIIILKKQRIFAPLQYTVQYSTVLYHIVHRKNTLEQNYVLF